VSIAGSQRIVEEPLLITRPGRRSDQIAEALDTGLTSLSLHWAE